MQRSCIGCSYASDIVYLQLEHTKHLGQDFYQQHRSNQLLICWVNVGSVSLRQYAGGLCRRPQNDTMGTFHHFIEMEKLQTWKVAKHASTCSKFLSFKIPVVTITIDLDYLVRTDVSAPSSSARSWITSGRLSWTANWICFLKYFSCL